MSSSSSLTKLLYAYWSIFRHLVNDGVEESPPLRSSQGCKGSQDLFANLEESNVGFHHWHPIAVTANGNKLAGQGEMGGLWEWTSSPLTKHEGFEPMTLYPAYTGMVFSLPRETKAKLTFRSGLFRREAQCCAWWFVGYPSTYCRQEELVSSSFSATLDSPLYG